MTIEECKNQVVISYEMRGFKGNLITDYSRFTAIYGKGEDLINDIVKLYASQFKSEISLLQEQLRLSEENNKVLLEKLKGGEVKKKEQIELDCPFDFTSRCTMGRCDCKPKVLTHQSN
jgi:hypothetical protein